MATTSTLPKFTVRVLTSEGLPLAGAKVRLISPLGVNATVLLHSDSVITTGPDGLFTAFLRSFQEVPPTGQYKLITANAGYEDVAYILPAYFSGTGSFTIQLLPRVALPTQLPQPSTPFVSTMFPVDITVPVPDMGAVDWQLLQIAVQVPGGSFSFIEVPTANGFGRANIAARLRLQPGFAFVPEGQVTFVDPFFSGQFTVVANSLSSSGKIGIAGEVVYTAVNMVPDYEGQNNCSGFTNTFNPANWIVSGEVVKFHGRYLDAMIWLPARPTENAFLVREHYRADNSVRGGDTLPVPFSVLVQRVAILDAPEGTVYSLYYFKNETDELLSAKLKIYYRA